MYRLPLVLYFENPTKPLNTCRGGYKTPAGARRCGFSRAALMTQGSEPRECINRYGGEPFRLLYRKTPKESKKKGHFF